MKKTLLTLLIICSIYMLIGNINATKNIIPNEAIRMRVIPNSNSEYDQEIKSKVKDKLQANMYNLLKDAKGIDNARSIIKANIPNINKNIEELLKKENYDLGYNLNYGYNYFPEKEYKGIEYKEGMYESILVTLGAGKGDNWWCVLFPPLCLLEAEESDNVEYKSFIKEIIDRYL